MVDEIIVVNDGSTDKTQQKVEQVLPFIGKQFTFELIRNKNSLGRGKARSMGIKRTKNPLILCIDGDIIPESGFINRLTRIMDEDPFLDIVAGSLKWKSINMGMWGEYYDFHITQTAKRQIGTALTLFKKSALERVNYLDETMTSGEDSEMFFRLQKAGIKFVKISDILGTHIENRTLFEMLQRHYQYGIDRYKIFSKHKDDMKGQYNPEELRINPPEILQLMQNLLGTIGTLGFRDAANNSHNLNGNDEKQNIGGR
jgi:cellulose synthase/poly-beta-1,6-N-acetylglucosamine synthase-like glycosyltransferase